MPNGLKRSMHAIVYQRQPKYIIKKAFTLMKRQLLCIILFAIGTYRLLVYDSSTIQGYHLGHYI